MDNKDNEVVYLHLDDIIPNRFQPRQVFDERALKELAVSIKEHGVIQPIIVRNIGNKYEIIAGERRYKASAMAGLTTIPAIIRNLDDKESSKVALLENLQRKNLNPIEEAKTYQKILELDQMTQEELAKTMGKSQSAIANKLRLLSLTDEVQDALLKDQISERHARTLLNAPSVDSQKKLLKEVIDNKLTVKELEEKIKPKENLNPTDIDKLLNPQPVNTNVSSIESIIPTDFSNDTTKPQQPSENKFNQSVGIDYSTPPKFIDYDVPNITENLESTATKPIDINAIKYNAKDINEDETNSNKTNIDEFLKIPSKEEQKEEPQQLFKFFSPVDEPQTDSNDKNKAPIFNTPTPTEPQINNVDPFSLGNETRKLEDSTSTSMDKLLSGVNDQANAPLNPSQSINSFNDPFAHNPLFQDNIENNKELSTITKPKYSLNESINLVRETLKKIEESGFIVDIDEVDLVNNYQITIKISKENNEG